MENYHEFENLQNMHQKIRKTVKKSSASDMPRNKLHSHSQFSADFYKISEKDTISWIQAALVDIFNILYYSIYYKTL